MSARAGRSPARNGSPADPITEQEKGGPGRPCLRAPGQGPPRGGSRPPVKQGGFTSDRRGLPGVTPGSSYAACAAEIRCQRPEVGIIRSLIPPLCFLFLHRPCLPFAACAAEIKDRRTESSDRVFLTSVLCILLSVFTHSTKTPNRTRPYKTGHQKTKVMTPSSGCGTRRLRGLSVSGSETQDPGRTRRARSTAAW